MTGLQRIGTFLALVLGLAAGGTALAQTGAADSPASAQTDAPPPPSEGGPHGGGMAHRLEMLQRQLNLSADQTASVRMLLETEHTQVEALRSNSALTPDQRHSQMMAARQEFSSKMHALLTTEQATKYDAMEARMKQHRPGGDGPPPAPSSNEGPGGN